VPHQCVAIVDPYSSGALLAGALHRLGVRCLAVRSSPRLPPAMKTRFDASIFAAVIDHDADLDATLGALAPHQPGHIVAGFESGVRLAEQLGERLGLPTNAPARRDARRDKFLMWETVRRAGLRTGRHFQSGRPDELLRWGREAGAWPLIAKPPSSAASDMIFCCTDEGALRHAAETILAEPNALGERNHAVVVQEMLDGVEFVVDTVSVDGRHKVTAYWEYGRTRAGGPPVGYDSMTLLPYVGRRQAALRAYAFRVLDALGIVFGPAHCELMWMDGEPVLMEVGARLSAGINAELSRICGGICQLDETVDAIVAPQAFLDSLDRRVTLQRRAANVFLHPQRPGTLKRVNHLDALARLPTLHSMSIQTTPGEMVKRVAGRATLVAADMRAIRRDMALIRRLERTGLFETDPQTNGHPEDLPCHR